VHEARGGLKFYVKSFSNTIVLAISLNSVFSYHPFVKSDTAFLTTNSDLQTKDANKNNRGFLFKVSLFIQAEINRKEKGIYCLTADL